MLHSHCEACTAKHCTVKADDISSCPMTTCEQGCGARFHQCLQSEHVLLCPDERVVCINVNYGCPVMMPRKNLGSHLEVCPASVLCCPIEWNRWPMYSVEDKRKLQLPSNIPKVKCGQLDVALAMRDQRMLVESLNAPKKIKRILRNRLTTRYPAVPFSHRSSSVESDTLTSEETSRNVSDDECGNVPWNLGMYPPGLQRSVCSRLIHATKQTADSLSATLDVASNHMSTSVTSVSSLESISEDKHETNELNRCDHIKDTNSFLPQNQQKSDNSEEAVSHVQKSEVVSHTDTDSSNNNFTNTTKLCDILGVDINIDCITKYQPKPPEMFTFLCAQEFRRDEYAWHFKNVHNDIQSCLNGWMEQRCPLAYRGCTFSFRRFQPKNGLSIIHSALTESFGLLEESSLMVENPQQSSDSMDVIHTDCNDISEMTSVSLPHNDVDIDSNHVPNLSPNSGTTHLQSPNQPHNLSANQSVDVINCNHSNRASIGDVEVFTSYRAYSPIHVQYSRAKPVIETSSNRTGLELLSLPFEILQCISRFLDSFSLCNLSLTCKLLREVGCSLLDERGIVIQVWEKVKDTNNKIKWQSFCNRWRFSTAFSPVKQWQFSGHNPIGTHLKSCAFNQDRMTRDSPFSVYPPGDAPMDHELRSLLAERQRDSVSVKLRELHHWYQQFQENHAEENNENDNSDADDMDELEEMMLMN